MPRLEDQWEKVGPAALALAPLAWLYAGGWVAYESIYRLGLKKAHRAPNPVICIGSLLAGGAGKTPVTLAVADHLVALGKRVIISTPGYRSTHQEQSALAPEGDLDPAIWGDETALIRWLRPHIPLIAGRPRVSASEIAAQHDSEAVLLLDDGFQHLPLHKDISIVLDPPDLSNRFTIPAGGYREPWRRGRRKASLVLPGDFSIVPAPTTLVDADRRSQPAPKEPVNALCAIARPERFKNSLAQVGIQIAQFAILPDHDPMTAGTLLDRFPPNQPLVVTGKDWVKLRRRDDLGERTILIAMHEVGIAPEESFRQWIKSRLDEVAQKG
jgi:tetraacyldisaccharide 4'-kinase